MDILDAIMAVRFNWHVVLGNIRAQRVGRAFAFAVRFCKTVWPRRDKSQLIKTLAALGSGARFISPRVPSSLNVRGPDMSTGNPCGYIFWVPQEKHKANFPAASLFGPVAKIAKHRHIHLAVQFAHERSPPIRDGEKRTSPYRRRFRARECHVIRFYLSIWHRADPNLT